MQLAVFATPLKAEVELDPARRQLKEIAAEVGDKVRLVDLAEALRVGGDVVQGLERVRVRIHKAEQVQWRTAGQRRIRRRRAAGGDAFGQSARILIDWTARAEEAAAHDVAYLRLIGADIDHRAVSDDVYLLAVDGRLQQRLIARIVQLRQRAGVKTDRINRIEERIAADHADAAGSASCGRSSWRCPN